MHPRLSPPIQERASRRKPGVPWRARSTDLAVLRTNVDKAFKDTAHLLVAWSNLRSGEVTAAVLDASTTGALAGMCIADYRRPAWSSDGRLIYFGTRQREPVAEALKKSDDKVSDVEIWHTNDVRMLPQQKTQVNADLRRTLLTAWSIRDIG